MGREATQRRGEEITKENARERQKASVEARKRNAAERLCMMEMARKLVTDEDRAAILSALLVKAKNADKDAVKLVLQLLGEMPDEKQTLDLKVQGLMDADRSLLNAVRERYEST